MSRGKHNKNRLCKHAFADTALRTMQVDFRCELPGALEDVQKTNPASNSVWCMGTDCSGYDPFDLPVWNER